MSSSISSEENPSKQESGPYTITKYDILTVFQAAPLAYQDLEGNLWPIGMLDFHLEREIVSDALKEAQRNDAKIDVAFETATIDRLGAFLAKGESEILHFSCHGHPDYLFIENGWGAGQQLLLPDLKEWIVAGGSSLRFVFVSACHSRSAGEAFVKAGVPHVVCCQQDSQQVRNTAAVEFARAFYRALACGRSLKEAFELGKHGVLLCPHVQDAGNEVKKFVLLPENADHNVQIFFTKPLPRTFAPKCWCPPRMFPVPPQPFIGRDVDMFRVVDAIRTARIVRVAGPSGAGKCSLVKAVGQYIYQRNLMDDIFWLPCEHKHGGDDILSWLSRLFEQFQDESPAAAFGHDRTYRVCRDEILEELHEKKALIIIDARKIGATGTNGVRKLTRFLEDLFQGTRNTKVIIVHRIGNDVRSRSFQCVEADVQLAPLGFESTVSLFASLCRYVADYDELFDLLVGQHEANTPVTNHRSSEIFKMLGEGIPARINDIAKTITPSEYDSIVSIAKRPVPAAFKSRAALEENLSRLGKEIEGATRLLDFRRAHEIQESLDEMEVLREALPDLATLRMMADEVRSDLEQAIFMKNFGTAAELQTELDSLNKQIKREVRDLPETRPPDDSKGGGSADRKAPLLSNTRAGLEAAIRMLEIALEEASDNNDFRQARVIDGKLLHLKVRKDKLPSSKQLSMQIGQLKVELKEAKFARHWDSAETLHHKIMDLEKKLDLERDAEKEIRMVGSEGEHQDKGRTKKAGFSESEQQGGADIGPRDPPGIYIPVHESKEEQKANAAGNLQQDTGILTPVKESHGVEGATLVKPGAVAVGGTQSPSAASDKQNVMCSRASVGGDQERSEEMSAEREEGKETQQSFTSRRKEFTKQLHSVLSTLPTDPNNIGAFRFPSEGGESLPRGDVTSEEQSSSTDRDVQQRRLDRNERPTQDMAWLHSSSSAFVPTGSTSTAPANTCEELVEDDSLSGRFLVESSRPATETPPASALTEKGRSLVIDGHLLNPEQAEKYCKLKGLCKLCGETQTHTRKRHGLLRKAEMEPMTTTDATGAYTVYKGYCLRPFCYTLEQARRELDDLEQLPPTSSRKKKSKWKKSRRYPADVSNVASCNHANEDLPVATAVVAVDEREESVAIASETVAGGFAASVVRQEEEEEAERAKFEKLIQETISKMTVTATKVEKVESAEEDEESLSQNNRRVPNPKKPS